MKVAVEAIEGCKRRLAVEAPVDVVQQEWERAYGRVQKQARLPGFRKGHVPRSLVKVHFSDDVRREVAEHLIPDVYRRALSEAKLDPVNEPDLQEVRLEEGAPLSFVAVVEVKPVITLGGYKGVEVEHAPAPVSGDELAATLEHMREQQAQFTAVERPAATGDLVVVDYTLAIDGHEPSSQTGYEFLVGAKNVLPEIVDAVIARHEFTVPDALVMRQVAHRIEHARESIRRQGIDPERMPWDYDKLIAELRPGAEKAVRRALMLEAIADKEAIAPSETDLDAEVEKLAQASQRPTPAVRRMMEKSGDLEGLRQGLRDRLTLELLVANAKVKA